MNHNRERLGDCSATNTILRAQYVSYRHKTTLASYVRNVDVELNLKVNMRETFVEFVPLQEETEQLE